MLLGVSPRHPQRAIAEPNTNRDENAAVTEPRIQLSAEWTLGPQRNISDTPCPLIDSKFRHMIVDSSL